MLLFLLALSAANPSDAVGSLAPVEGENVAHVASLAEFAFSSLKAQSNSLDLAELSFDKVISAEQQVVAGMNFHVNIGLQPHGSVSLKIFEQSWTNTLQVTEAKLSPSDVSMAVVDLVSSDGLTLDAAEFAQFAAARAPKADDKAAEAKAAAAEPEAAKEKVGWVSWVKSKLRRKRARA